MKEDCNKPSDCRSVFDNNLGAYGDHSKYTGSIAVYDQSGKLIKTVALNEFNKVSGGGCWWTFNYPCSTDVTKQ